MKAIKAWMCRCDYSSGCSQIGSWKRRKCGLITKEHAHAKCITGYFISVSDYCKLKAVVRAAKVWESGKPCGRIHPLTEVLSKLEGGK